MTLYLVTIITDHHLTCLQMRAKDKPTAAEKGVDVFIASEKPPGGGVGLHLGGLNMVSSRV